MPDTNLARAPMNLLRLRLETPSQHQYDHLLLLRTWNCLIQPSSAFMEKFSILRACMDERQASSFSDRTGAVFLLNYCSHYLDLHLKLAVESINQSKSFVS